MPKGRGRKKIDKNVTTASSDDQKGGTGNDDTLVRLSTLAKDPLASQDKRTNEDLATHNGKNKTNRNDASAIVSLSQKKGKLKLE